ncbi:MAG: PQQ-like beta-propeller repeat protein [Bacteroidales bacterium]|nr:PQQ-like beta-propeller repeat protein [Bacteroidales bacterium]
MYIKALTINRFLTLIFCILMFSGELMTQEIVQWRGPHRDGKYPATGLMKSWPDGGPTLLWHVDGLGQGHASAVVTDDRIYTAGTLEETGYIFCFSPEGKLLWKVPYGPEWTESWPGTRSTPLYMDGKLYMMSGFGHLFCIDATDGKKIWQVDLFTDYDGRNIKWGVTENLLIDGDMLFCTPGGEKNNVIALNRNNGELIWSCAGKGEVSAYCSPLLIKLPKRRLLVTQTANSILGIDAKNGTLLWSHSQTNKWSVHANTPYYQDGYLYCVSGYGKGGIQLKLAADGSTKQEMWRNTSIDNRMGGFVVLRDRIYGSDDSNKGWFAVDWKTGQDIYEGTMPGRGVIIYADGMFYCYNDTGELALAKPTSSAFEKVSSFEIPYGEAQHWAHLVISDGKLFVRHGESLMAFDLCKP